MRKTRLSIALMTTLLSVGTLSGCDIEVSYSPTGTLINYTVGSDKTSITAEEIFAEYYNDSDKYQSIFDAIKSIIIRNYFSVKKVELDGKEGIEIGELANGTKEVLGYAQLDELNQEVARKVESDKHEAKLNAKNNSTSYDTEFDKILSSKGVETEEELENKYLDELKAEKFDENYYKYQIGEMKNGSEFIKNSDSSNFWDGYFNDMAPYHVSHILVKLEDSSATNYYNGTVSEANCEKLYRLTEALKSGEETFQAIAKLRSDDTGSAQKGGDLGIMDYSTGFVNEFKLGVYAYENLFGANKAVANDESKSKIYIPGTSASGIEQQYVNAAITDSFDGKKLPTVDSKVFKELFDARKLTKATDQEQVMEGSTLVYPRNLIYNKYLNRHSFAFVTNSEETNTTKLNNLVEGATGYHKYTAADGIGSLVGKTVLTAVVAKQYRPILMVRAGTSDYQGIHFIIVDRDPFVETDKNGVTRDNYYTTYHVTQDGYPKDENGNAKQTYVNFNGLSGTESNNRADSFISTLKSFDSDKLSKFIFKKYMAKEEIKIADADLEAALNKWIDKSIASNKLETKNTWEKTWSDYVSTLRKQNDARGNIVSQACRVGFDKDLNTTYTKETFKAYMQSIGMSETEIAGVFEEFNFDNIKTYADLYNVKGALCNDGKKHND